MPMSYHPLILNTMKTSQYTKNCNNVNDEYREGILQSILGIIYIKQKSI